MSGAKKNARCIWRGCVLRSVVNGRHGSSFCEQHTKAAKHYGHYVGPASPEPRNGWEGYSLIDLTGGSRGDGNRWTPNSRPPV